MNNQLREAVNLRRTNYNIKGTAKYKELRLRNQEIILHNTRVTFDKEGTIKKQLIPARLYLFKALKVLSNKGGLNFVWYAFKVL